MNTNNKLKIINERMIENMDANAPCIKVKCGVENCSYNKELMCFANGLEVNAMHGHKADISDETCCTTFKDKA